MAAEGQKPLQTLSPFEKGLAGDYRHPISQHMLLIHTNQKYRETIFDVRSACPCLEIASGPSWINGGCFLGDAILSQRMVRVLI